MRHSNRDEGTDVRPDDVLAVLMGAEPMLTEELEEQLGVRHRVAATRLEQLHDRGRIARKSIGTQLTVWWVERGHEDGQKGDTESMTVAREGG